MDANTYDLTKLDTDELFELRELQGKITKPPRPYELLTLDELFRLEDLHYKMLGQPNPNPREHAPATYCHWCGHVVGVAYTHSNVPGVCCSEQCLENSQLARHRRGQAAMESQPVASRLAEPVKATAPAAVAPEPAAPVAAAPAPPVKPTEIKPEPSSLRQLDALMRFGT